MAIQGGSSLLVRCVSDRTGLMSAHPAFGEHYYRSSDDRLTLYARDYASANKDEAGLPLLMMHGLTRNSADFEPFIERLGSGRRMIAVDQRGRARSEYDPRPENYRPDVYAEDMWALLESLAIDRVILIGTSLGGLMSILMGAARPDRIAGIVINDIGPKVEDAGLDRIRGYVGSGGIMQDWAAAAAACKAINDSAMEGFGEGDWLAFAKRTCRQLPDGSVEFAYDPAIAGGMAEEEPATIPPDLWQLWDQLAEIPVLSLRGSMSDILSSDTVDEMARRHPSLFYRADIPGRGHAPILDEPVAVDAIRDFLSQFD